MKHCSNCGTLVNDNANFCEKCGYSFSGNNPLTNDKNDAPSGGFAILSFFFPLIGLILWLAWSKSPLKAKSCGKGALAGFIVGVILFFIFIFIGVPIITAMNITSKEDPSFLSDNLSDVPDEVLSWYTGIGTVTTKARYSIDQTVTVNMIIGYNYDDTVTLSELESLKNELRDFTKRFFSEKMGLELTISNENQLEREIIEILNSRYLNKAKIKRIKFEEMEVKGDY
jgi:flagellar basal body-associated protein FliL